MRIVLARHGESRSIGLAEEEPCPQDHANPLTARGIGQVERLASEVADLLTAPRLFASDMQRALESAQILAGRLNIHVATWPELREIWEVPANLTLGDVRRTYLQFWRDFYFGDANGAAVARARRQADALQARIVQEFRENSDMILVGHGGIIEVFLSGLLSGHARPGRSIEYGMETGAFHLLDLMVECGRLSHVRVAHLNRIP